MQDDDPWQLAGQADAAPVAGSGFALVRKPLLRVTPLDDQFGIDPPKTVPDALSALLFDTGDDSADRLGTFALLDAAQIVNLPEVLAASGVPHACLFQGDARDTLGGTAPWLVELAPTGDFTRNLFTASAAPWHLWDKAPAIFLRAATDLDGLRAHLRRFTRVQDKTGAWFFIRFYDPAYLKAYLGAMSIEKQRFFTGPITRFVLKEGQDVTVIEPEDR